MTEYINIEGYAAWAKVTEDNYDEYLGNKFWCVNLTFKNGKEEDKFRRTGIGLQIKQDGDGGFVKFRRPLEKVIKGETVYFDPPKITVWDAEKEEFVPFTEEIGNGSLIRCNVSYFQTMKGVGHRLEGITVLDHVPYEKKESVGTNTNINSKSPAGW